MSNEFKNPLILAMNLVRYIGNVVSNTNNPVILLGTGTNDSDEININKIIESPSTTLTESVVTELLVVHQSLITG